MKTITRDDVKEILLKWNEDVLSATDVHEWASNRYAVDGYDFTDWEGDDDFSVTNEVLGELGISGDTLPYCFESNQPHSVKCFPYYFFAFLR